MSPDSPAPGEVEKLAFQAEVSRVLDIVINSLYSHREIFLRELISNASDALDRLRFRSTTDESLLGDEKSLEIEITPDREAHTLTIRDTGLGMTREELINNLGTIARSGSQKFLEAVKESGGGDDAVDLIGRFGVGFYSAFIVADRVEVTSRAAGEESAHRWVSDGRSGFEIAALEEERPRGTEIKLHLKEDAHEYAEDFQLKSLVRRYSDFVAFPIKLWTDEGDEKKEPKLETINRGRALWRRPKSEIEKEDYDELYRHITHDFEEPLEHVHFQIEGTLAFSGLLYIPRTRPFYGLDRESAPGIKLYVKRVFIMEDCKELLPPWLRFVRGIVDSDDLPLNVSRELLQQDRVTRSIRKTVTSRVLGALEKMADKRPEDYATFWEAFGIILKEGLIEHDHEEKERLTKLLRFTSSRSELTSLAEYVERMGNPEKEPIYYAVGPSKEALEASPHLEGLIERGFEVLFLTDPIDDWLIREIPEFDGKKLRSATQGEIELDEEEKKEEEEAKKEDEKELPHLLVRAKSVLEDDVSEVRTTRRLHSSPACLVASEHAHSPHIERLMRAQGQEIPRQKRVLELNPTHPVVKKLESRLAEKEGDARTDEWIRLLRDQALLAEGSPIEDPQGFAKRMSQLMEEAL